MSVAQYSYLKRGTDRNSEAELKLILWVFVEQLSSVFGLSHRLLEAAGECPKQNQSCISHCFTCIAKFSIMLGSIQFNLRLSQMILSLNKSFKLFTKSFSCDQT